MRAHTHTHTCDLPEGERHFAISIIQGFSLSYCSYSYLLLLLLTIVLTLGALLFNKKLFFSYCPRGCQHVFFFWVSFLSFLFFSLKYICACARKFKLCALVSVQMAIEIFCLLQFCVLNLELLRVQSEVTTQNERTHLKCSFLKFTCHQTRHKLAPS